MKILFLVDQLGLGGKERTLIELLKNLDKEKDYKLFLIVLKDLNYFPELVNYNINVFKTTKRKKIDIKILITILKIIVDIKPDVIHTWSFLPSIYISMLRLLFKFVHINSMIGGAKIKNFKIYIYTKLVFSTSDIITTNSKVGLIGYKVPFSKGICVYNGFDFKRINNLKDKENLKRELKIKNEFIVGMVANFRKEKDYYTYLETARFLVNVKEDLIFICIGDGPDKNKYFNEYGKSTHILFLGRKKNVESFINIFDIGVLTCNTKIAAEGNSNVIMEYMALAKPVIATDSGGNKEILINNKNGYIIKPFNKQELIEKILFLNNNPIIRNKMGSMGKKRIMRYFNINNMVEKFEMIYQNLY